MSLIHWWPLNGNTTDYGINNTALINNGATVNSAGKIGKCYSFNNNNMVVATSDIMSATELSLCLWLKLSTSHSGYAQVLVLGTSGTSWNNIRCGIDINGDGRIYFNVSSGSANTNIYSPLNYKDNIWHHITGIYNNGSLQLYIDGIQVAAGTTTNVPGLSGTSIYVGGNAGGEKANNGDCLNDIRIYDHALSAKEVKEISKGLMLHYNFEDNCQQLVNAYGEPTFNTSAANGGWNHWGSTGHAGSYAQNTDANYIYPGFSAYSHKVANGSNATKDYLLYQEKLFDGGYRSMQAIIKASDGAAITNSVCYPDWNGRNGGVASGSWTSIESLGNGFYLCKVEGIKQTTSPSNKNAHLVGIYVKAGKTIYVTCCYLENGKQLCSDIFDPNPKCYDCSGYGYNGTNNGVILSNDSISGKFSAQFASDAYIEIPSLPQFDKVTYSMWVKIPSNTQAYRSIFIPKGNPTAGGIWLSVNTEGVNLWAYQGGNTPNYCKGTSALLRTDTWYLYTHTFDGTTGQNYLNGVAVGSAATYTTRTYIPRGAYTLGDSYTGTSWNGTPFDGKIADFKIYATALSAEDILAEYNRKAAIDKKGNLFTGEFIETNTNANIADKNNQIKATYFVEGKDKVKIFGGYTELDYFDQINPAAGTTSQHNRCTISDISYDHIEARVKVTGQGTSGGIVFSNGMWWKTYTGRGGVNDGSGTVTMTPASFSQNIWTDVRWDFSKVFSILYTSGWSDGINYWTPQNLKVAYIKTYIGSELTGHFIPVKNKNNVIGLFNLITNKFYSNTGTGTEGFIAGNSLGKLSLIQENKIEEL